MLTIVAFLASVAAASVVAEAVAVAFADQTLLCTQLTDPRRTTIAAFRSHGNDFTPSSYKNNVDKITHSDEREVISG